MAARCCTRKKKGKTMKIKTKQGAPSLKNYMNRGGTFKLWRHDYTNYDAVAKELRKRFGFDSEQYMALVVEFGGECISGLSNVAHKAAVAEWMISKGV